MLRLGTVAYRRLTGELSSRDFGGLSEQLPLQELANFKDIETYLRS